MLVLVKNELNIIIKPVHVGELFEENQNRHSWEISAVTVLSASRCKAKSFRLWWTGPFCCSISIQRTFVLGQYGCSLRAYLGKLIPASLVREHSAISANNVTQLLAGLFD